MSVVADQLRQARQTQNLTLQQVAEITKIRTDHLRALEEGHFEIFSAPVYVRGFVRSYATLLKLDVPQVMRALDTELAETSKFRERPTGSESQGGVLDFLMLQLSRVGLRKGLIGLGVLMVLIGIASGWLLWRHHRPTDPLSGLKPGLYQPTQHLSGETLPLPSPAPPR